MGLSSDRLIGGQAGRSPRSWLVGGWHHPSIMVVLWLSAARPRNARIDDVPRRTASQHDPPFPLGRSPHRDWRGFFSPHRTSKVDQVGAAFLFLRLPTVRGGAGCGCGSGKWL